MQLIHKLQVAGFITGTILASIFGFWVISGILFVFGDDPSPPILCGWKTGVVTFLGLPLVGALEESAGVQRMVGLTLRLLKVKE